LLICLTALVVAVTPVASAQTPALHPDLSHFSTARITDNQKRECVYSHDSVDALASFKLLVSRRTIDCAMVYTGSPDWAGWVNPWFLHVNNPDTNWAEWVRHSPANDRRQLIISQPLIPTFLAHKDWLKVGAAGGYEKYARAFARNLVAYGVPDAVIRLSWEMNGTWNVDSIPDTPQGDREWVRFWQRTVIAMRSVPGAHFTFDWCPNNGVRAIPLNDYYPGDKVVDIIGDDAYDQGVPAGDTDRWQYIYNEPDGLKAIIAFARQHDKPLSLPEWGVGTGSLGYGGDDGSYVRDMASVVDNNDVAFQTYFYHYSFASQLQRGSRVLAAYRQAFGRHGYAVGPDHGTDITRGPKPVQ
jgi:Glycosyl hydrolase family 26